MAGVPYTFATATTSIPLSQLDANFNTGLTIGNTTVGLGNTVTTLGNLTLTNVTIASGTTNVSANSIVNGTSNVVIASSGGAVNIATNGTTGITIDTSQVLKVTNNANFGFQLTAQTGGVTGSLYADSSAFGITASNVNLNNAIYTTNTNTAIFRTSGTEAMRIDSLQRVGISTNSPTNSLQVAGGISSTSNSPAFQANAAIMDFSAGTARFNATGADNSTNGVMTFNTASANAGVFNERMRITSGGAVLIGTTSATNTFVVSSASGGTAVAQIINTSSSGNVISVASTLQSNGNNTSSAHFQGNTTGVGNWYLFGNGTSSYSSDERLKKNIETTRSGYLEDLCKLRVVKYNWRLDEEGKNKELGLIAQEVEQVFPNLVQDDLNPVSQDDDTIYKQLKQSVLPFMLLKAIQELNAKVTALEAKLGA